MTEENEDCADYSYFHLTVTSDASLEDGNRGVGHRDAVAFIKFFKISVRVKRPPIGFFSAVSFSAFSARLSATLTTRTVN